MKRHELKTWPEYFAMVACQVKPFEVRKADRDFRPGDELLLKEWCPQLGQYTDNTLLCKVTCVVSPGPCVPLADGFVVMGISLLQFNGVEVE